ncbi:hypothetical protein P8C59_008919 [Phyllachora maydis]|uniref:C2H2-type domain-containing protein n=1 Tax=Phyllachora maydis TaxID=1825666 RepID=A0AAD9IBG1_9PEZI|nr:hypothetical protein P8C59_008919 [Phyllachora maydis]
MTTISGSRMAPNVNDVSRIDVGMSHPYTCNTCQVAFRNSDLQKGHMRTDWHRYNLKRRVATLPPISSEVFTEKVLQARAASTAEADKAGFEKPCDTCHKTYYSENQYRNHIGSAKHKAKLAASPGKSNTRAEDDASSMVTSTFSLGTPAVMGTDFDSDAEEEFNVVVEGFRKTGLQESVSPVKRPSNPRSSAEGQNRMDHGPAHSTPKEVSGSTTPNTTEVTATSKTETTGMSPKNCLFLQTHMRDIGHCKIPYSTEAEQLDIGDFYDFRSTYSDGGVDAEDESMDDDDDDDEPSGGAKLGGARRTKITGENGEEMEKNEDEGWETDSSESSLDSNDLHGVPADNHYHHHKRAHAVFYDENELHLPSGKSLALRDATAHGRVIANRETRGLGAVAIANPKQMSKTVLKGRKKEFSGQKMKELGVSKHYLETDDETWHYL